MSLANPATSRFIVDRVSPWQIEPEDASRDAKDGFAGSSHVPT